MKITYIVGVFPKLSETFVLHQITDLIDAGHEVEILSLTRSDETVVHEEVTKYGLLAKTNFIARNSSSLGFDITDRFVSSLVFTDIIHAHFAAEPTDFALKISKTFGIPFVFTAHAYDIFINPDALQLREKFLAATQVITVSNFNRQYLVNLLGDDVADSIEILRYGINTKKFRFMERGLKKHTTFLLIGRFVEKKGIPFAIEAMRDVIKTHPNVELRIIGDGELQGLIEQKITELKLHDHIKLLGGQPHSVVVSEMEDADAFLLPSVTAANGDREGVPLVLLEAQAMGLPVISTFHSGIPEGVVDTITGFLVPERDPVALATKMKLLIEKPELRHKMGAEGRKFIEAQYSHEEEMQKLQTMFLNLVGKRKLVSAISKEQRSVLESRLRSVTSQLIEYRGDQLKKLNESITRNDDRIIKIEEVTRVLVDIQTKDNQLRQKDQQLMAKDIDLRHKEEIVYQKDQQLIAKDTDLRQKEEIVRQKDQQLIAKDTDLRQKEEIVRQKDQQLLAKDIDLRHKEEIVHQKDQQLIAKDTDLRQKEEIISQVINQLRDRESSIVSLQQTLVEENGVIQKHLVLIRDLETKATNQETVIEDVRKELNVKELALKREEEKLKALYVELKQKSEEVAAYKQWIDNIHNTPAFRLYDFFVGRLVKNLKKKAQPKLRLAKTELLARQIVKRDTLMYLPDWSKANPYQKLLYDAIIGQKIPCGGLQGKDFTMRWLMSNRHQVKIIHLHWLYGVYDHQNTGLSTLKAIMFCGKLVAARLFRYRILWTAHNLASHELIYPRLELFVRRFVAAVSHRVIVHCASGKQNIQDLWNISHEKIEVIPHGSYLGHYPNAVSAVEARKKLSIPDGSFVFLFFGMVRRYKGLDTLIMSFKKVKSKYKKAHLIIAGMPNDDNIKNQIESTVKGASVTLALQFVNDNEVQHYFNAADVVVLPYRNILTSGSAVLALTFGKPVIAPGKGCLPELIDKRMGILYDTDDELTSAMMQATQKFRKRDVPQETAKIMRDLDWQTIVKEKYMPLITE